MIEPAAKPNRFTPGSSVKLIRKFKYGQADQPVRFIKVGPSKPNRFKLKTGLQVF